LQRKKVPFDSVYGMAVYSIAVLAFLTAGNAVFAQGEGDQFVRNSLNSLLTLRNVECDIRLETFVEGREYAARGRYAEQVLPQAARQTFLRSVYRLDINFSMGSPPAAHAAGPNQLTLVCHASEDGGVHLIEQYTSIEGVKVFSTVDLKRLENRLRTSQRDVFFSQASEVRNLGGLAGKMRQISRFYEFSLPVQENLPVPTRDNLQKEETVPTLKLTGALRGAYQNDLLARFGGLDQRGHYPAEFPSDIEIWLGQLDDFPYKIRYLRRTSENSDQRTLLFQETYFNVVLNEQTIPSARFARLTIPEDIFRVSDETDHVLWTLGL